MSTTLGTVVATNVKPSYALGPDAMLSGFNQNNFGPNDDGSYPCTSTGAGTPSGCTPSPVQLPFSVDFYGKPYNSLYINNNGDLTFGAALSTFTPYPLSQAGPPIIAPFFADVDTRSGNTVTFGTGTVGGEAAFGVNWPGVGCYSENTSVLDYFQVLLIDRNNLGQGDFDVEFNYDQVQWDSGEASGGNSSCQGGTAARAGFASGEGGSGSFYELPGSGADGAFLDSNNATGLVHNASGSSQLGRYVYEFRGGRPLQTSPENVSPVGGDLAAAQTFGGGDESTQCPCATPVIKKPYGIMPSDGDLVETAQDISVPGAGVPLHLTRTYDSGLAQQEASSGTPPGPFGYGWSYNLGMTLTSTASTGTATVTQEDGSEVSFSPYLAGSSPAWCTGTTNYCADAPRDLATLNHNSDGSWTFTRDTGGTETTFEFSSAGALIKETDQAGGSLTATTGTPGSGQCPSSAASCTVWASSASGRGLTLAFDVSGRLLSASDEAGNTVSYCYFGQSCANGASGGGAHDLYSVVVPGGATTTYGYDTSNARSSLVHDLVSEVLPTGGTVANTYNSLGEVVSQVAPSEGVTLSYSGDNQSVPGGSTIVSTWPAGTSGSLPAQVVGYQFSSGALVAETTGYGTSSASTQYFDLDPVSLVTTTVQDGNGNQSSDIVAGYGNGAPPLSVGDVTLSTDALGNTTEYQYNSANQVWCEVLPAEYLDHVACPSSEPSSPPAPGATDPYLGATINFYGSAGELTATTGPLGNTTTYAYTSGVTGVPDDLLYCSVDPVGYQKGVSCPAYGAAHVTATTTSTFDSAGDQTSFTNADGATTTYIYGAPGHPGLVSSSTSPDGTVTSYTYDAAGQVTAETKSFGAYTATSLYAYDQAGNEYCSVAPAEAAKGVTCPSSPPSSAPTVGNDPYLGATITTYDTAGRAVQVANPLGGITYNAYDQAGNEYCSVAPAEAAKGVTCPSSPPSSAPTVGNDPYLGATITTYDPLGQPVQVTNPLGGITLSAYDANGNVTQTTVEGDGGSSDPNVVTTYTYDAADDMVSTTVGPGSTNASTTVQAYDPNGNVYCSASADAVASGNYQCPAWQPGWAAVPPNPTSLYSSTPDATQANNVTTTFFDANGDELQTTGPNAQTTVTASDADGRAYCSSDPANVGPWLSANPSATYPYLCPSTPPASAPTGTATGYTTTVYDAAGQVLSSTDPAGDTTSYTYSPGGQVLTTTNPNGDVTTNCYYYEDASGGCAANAPSGAGSADDLYSTASPPSGSGPTRQLTTYTYFPGGQTKAKTTPAGTTTYAYDANGGTTSKTYSATASGYSAPANASYTYNQDGTLATMADGTGTTTYAYDANGATTSVTNGAGLQLAYSYFPNGELSSLTYPNAKPVTYAYNPAGQESSLTDWLGNETSFAYDASGNLTTTTFPNGVTEKTSYDKANAVSSITDTKGASTLASFSYSRNPDEQVTSETDTGTPGPASQSYTYDQASRVTSGGGASYSYDPASQLTTGPGGATQAYNAAGELCWAASSPPAGSTCPVTPTGATTYSYGSLGERTQTTTPSSSSTYGWDQAGRLTSATSPSGSVGYSYDASGLLSERSAAAGSANMVWGPVSGAQPLLVDDGTNYYIYGPGSLPTEQVPVASGAPEYYLHGQRGSTRLLTGSTGSVAASWTYDAWGRTLTSTAATASPTPAPISSVGQLGYAFNATTLDVSPKAVGDLVTLVASLTGATVTSVSGGGVTTWHKDVAYLGPEMGNDNEIWWGVVTSTGASTISLGLSATPSGDELVAQEFTAGSGVTWSADGSGAKSSSSTSTVSFPSLSPSQPGELYFGYSEVQGGGVSGSTAGFNYAFTQEYSNVLAWGTDVSSAVAPTATQTGNADDAVAALFSATTSVAGSPAPISSVGQIGYTVNATTLDVSPKSVGDLVALVAGVTGATVTSVSGGGVTTWHKDVAYLGPEMGSDNEIWWGVVTSAGASTISLGLSATPSGDELVAQEFTAGSGVTWSADGSGSTSSSTSTVTYPSLSPSQPGELYFGYSEVAANTQPGSTPGFSYSLTGVYGNLLAWDTDVSSTVSPTSTEAGSASDAVAALFSATTSPVVTTPLLWEGQYQDPTTGLYYMRARWYDPATGQFLSVDPALAETGQPYAYAGDDPVNSSDPSGLAYAPGSASLGVANPYCALPYVTCGYTDLRFAVPYSAELYVAGTQGVIGLNIQLHKYFQTSLGNRFVDVYNSWTDQITEVKTGAQGGPAIALQAEKDAFLVRNRGGISTGRQPAPVNSAVWDFYPNGAGTTAPGPSIVGRLSSLAIDTNIFFYQSGYSPKPVRSPSPAPYPPFLPIPLPARSGNPEQEPGPEPVPVPAYTYFASSLCPDVLA